MEKENPRGEKEDQVTRPLWRVFCCQDWKRFQKFQAPKKSPGNSAPKGE